MKRPWKRKVCRMIVVSPAVWDRLRGKGDKGESMDDVLRRILGLPEFKGRTRGIGRKA